MALTGHFHQKTTVAELTASPEQIHVNLPVSGPVISALRLDTDPVAGGNKLHKLKYNLQAAQTSGTLVTMGGAFSNHIAATARYCRQMSIKAIGIIRGERSSSLSITLKRAMDDGMELQFTSRDDYRKYRNINFMQEHFPGCYCVPEGGSNSLAVKGCTEILNGIHDFDIVIVATGTGATLAGITASLQPHQSAMGICVVKGAGYIHADVNEWLKDYPEKKNFSINHDYHFGGYAKTTPALLEFVKQFNETNTFSIEPIYTGKLFYALYDLAKKEHFSPGRRILAVHTGGLQYLS